MTVKMIEKMKCLHNVHVGCGKNGNWSLVQFLRLNFLFCNTISVLFSPQFPRMNRKPKIVTNLWCFVCNNNNKFQVKHYLHALLSSADVFPLLLIPICLVPLNTPLKYCQLITVLDSLDEKGQCTF